MNELERKQLIVNADDFGRSQSVNAGIIDAYDRGIVTSTSLMVRRPAASEAAQLAKRRFRLSVGLHIDLGAWFFEDGEWKTRYEVISLDDPHQIKAELRRQLATFQELIGNLPTHLDSHQHVHRDDPVRGAVMALADRLSVPVRSSEQSPISYCGQFYGQTGHGEPYHEAISIDNLISIIERLPPGITELGCHPARGGEQESVYNVEREIERQVLCDRRLQATLVSEGIDLISFRDLPVRTSELN